MSYENRILIPKVKRPSKIEFPNLPFPFSLDVRKLKGQQYVYRLRVGDYRVIFEYDKEERLVKILKIGKRGGIYD